MKSKKVDCKWFEMLNYNLSVPDPPNPPNPPDDDPKPPKPTIS
jgi:hypothetical protein